MSDELPPGGDATGQGSDSEGVSEAGATAEAAEPGDQSVVPAADAAGDAGTAGQKAPPKFFGVGSWIPLISLAVFVGLFVFGIKFDWFSEDIKGKTLGFDTELIVIAAAAGFLGSFVNVLNKAYKGDYDEKSYLSRLLFPLMRPLTGAMLGLFMLGAFGSGFIAMPIGDTDGEVIKDIPKDEAFIFAVAFVAGLVDEFVLVIVSRFTDKFRTEAEKENKKPGEGSSSKSEVVTETKV